MKKKEKKHRIGLTLLMSALVFVTQIIAVALAVTVVLLLIRAGVIRPEEQASISTGNVVFFMALISLIAGMLLAMLSSKYYMQPVNRFINYLNRLAAGDFKTRIHFGKPIASHPTFREIEDSFNAAAEELDQTQMLRSDFINNFSHEFKTPIVSIAGFAKLLRRGNLTPQQQEEYLQIIEEESLRLAQMATGVLELTKVENQSILTDVTGFNVTEQVRSAIVLLEDQWTKKNLDFNLRMEEVTIRANAELLRHVWVNLLDNAVKFSEEYGCVDVAVERKDPWVRVTIANTGSRIPEQSLGRIFQKFYQADESHACRGNGVGLAVVEKAVKLHNGRVWAKSTEDLTTFTVELPITQ